MDTRYYGSIDNTPALILATRAQYELLLANYTDINILSGSHEAFAAFDNNRAVGIILFNSDKYEDVIEIELSFVLPEYRRKGVYSLLWQDIVDKAQSEGIKKIMSSVDTKNKPMLACAKKLGKYESQIVFYYNIPEE